jgi:hypothetical protein
MSELDALRRHLGKGRLISTWEARYLPGRVLSAVAEAMAKGATIDLAILGAEPLIAFEELGSLVKGQSEDTPPDNAAIAQAVYQQLLADYPAKSLGWLKTEAVWRGPLEIPLEKIDYAGRKSWAAWHEPERVAEFEQLMRRKIKKGKHVTPAVLIDRTGSSPGEELMVMDGHHRALAALKAHLPLWAYVGTVQSKTGPWLQLHSSQLKDSVTGSRTGAL